MPMVTKLGKLVQYNELQIIMSYDLSITWCHEVAWVPWCHEVAWEIKYVIFPLALDQWSPSVARCYHVAVPSTKSHTWSHEVTWQIKNIKSPLQESVRHQMSQGGDMLLRAPTHKVTWTFNYVVPWYHVTCWLRGAGSEHNRLSYYRLLVVFFLMIIISTKNQHKE